jgi:hypothetical protein
LIGTAQSRINFSANSTAAPGLAQPNNQSLTSPDKTQVVPGFDARLGTAYTFPPSNAGLPRNGATSSKHLHDPRPVSDGRLVVLAAPSPGGPPLARATRRADEQGR